MGKKNEDDPPVRWTYQLFFSDGESEWPHEFFDTEEEAKEAADQWISDYTQGTEYLNMIGDEVYEVDDDIEIDVFEEYDDGWD